MRKIFKAVEGVAVAIVLAFAVTIFRLACTENSLFMAPTCAFVQNPSADGVALFHNLGLVLITISIPFFIAVFQDIKSSGDFEKLDQQTVLKTVLQINYFISGLVLVFLFPLLMKLDQPFWFKSMYFCGYWIGLVFLVLTLKSIFDWLSSEGKRWGFRLRYLENLSSADDYENQTIIWNEIWAAKTWNTVDFSHRVLKREFAVDANIFSEFENTLVYQYNSQSFAAFELADILKKNLRHSNLNLLGLISWLKFSLSRIKRKNKYTDLDLFLLGRFYSDILGQINKNSKKNKEFETEELELTNKLFSEILETASKDKVV